RRGLRVRFEWDENKNRSNQAKHGLAFELARAAFADPYAIFNQDRHIAGEERWQVTALIGSMKIIVVAHTYPGEQNGQEIIRIVSARAATSPERRRYDRARLDQE